MAQAPNLNKVIMASAAGTMIEWYDFYLFGSLATIIATQFFPKGHETAAFLSTLAIFGTGFVVRPFGALVFGRMGDLVGRKVTFLLTLLMMGISTCVIGLLPNYESVGILAPIMLVVLRLIQGLALGGEYGGAATYVAEHAPEGKRGYYTSFIQTTATLGLLLSLIVILVTRTNLGEPKFADYGWRIPFLISAVLVVFSYFIRRKMEESPLFAEIKAKKATSANPLRDSFMNPENRKWVLLALFGATAGQGVVWYTGQFYAMTFMEKILGISAVYVNIITGIALAAATPFFIVFGSLSDKIGRMKLISYGCLLAALAYVPIYRTQLSLVDTKGLTVTSISSEMKPGKDGAFSRTEKKDYGSLVVSTTTKSDAKPDDKPKVELIPSTNLSIMLGLLVFVQVLFVTMVYGPIAAFLVELFPTRIRYTSMSLPYHIGNGVFGGLVPLIATALVTRTENKLMGLAYPIGIALITFVVGSLFLKEDRKIDD